MIKSAARRSFLKKSFSLLSMLSLYGCSGGESGRSGASSPPDTGTAAPSIIRQPQDASAIEGESVDFSVLVESDTPVSYQWRKNGVDIIGAIDKTYTALQITLVENGDLYSTLITNSAGTILSNEAELIVLMKGQTVDSTFLTVDSTTINVA